MPARFKCFTAEDKCKGMMIRKCDKEQGRADFKENRKINQSLGIDINMKGGWGGGGRLPGVSINSSW